MLEVAGLRKAWPRFSLALDILLGDGEIAAVLGPSGCGKSTLLRLVSGLVQPDEGTITIDGRDVSGLPPERRGIGFVFQDFALFPHLSVRHNIEYGPRMKGLSRPARRETAEAIASSFEISALLERVPYSLSGGEQQRVALARTLAADPALILMDEPLSSLDASSRRRLRTEIADSLRAAGVSAIVVTHDPEEALAVADRICLMREGRIEAEGMSEELYVSPPTAWSAAFLDRGPVLDILSLEMKGYGFLARTPIGDFRCDARAEMSDGSKSSLFFPAEAPRGTIAGEAAHSAEPNRISGKVASSSFAGRFRRVTLDCQIVAGPASGSSLALELELPPIYRPCPGETLEFEIPPDRCRVLPG